MTSSTDHPALAAREAERAAQSAALAAELNLPPEAPWLAALHQSADAMHLAEAVEQTTCLGNLIDALADSPASARVQFAGAGLAGTRPSELTSWRGCYADLAITFTAVGECGPAGELTSLQVTEVGDLLQALHAAVGQTFQGWKGGDFTMSRSTPVWVAQQGTADRVGITGLSVDAEDGGTVLLHVVDHGVVVTDTDQ